MSPPMSMKSGSVLTGYHVYRHPEPFPLHYHTAVLSDMHIAYETWGELDPTGCNAVLIFTGVSLSSHARSHAGNTKRGWWEDFIAPDSLIDTSKYFVICANHIGSCFGSTGPSSIDPATGHPYAMTFPILSVHDLVRAQFCLLDYLGIHKLYACIGASLGGMCSLLAGALFGDRMDRMVSISACKAASPMSIASTHLQRKAIKSDPNWQDGKYYGGPLPLAGMQLAREIATIGYRSGPEWRQRFGRKPIDGVPIGVHPTFAVEQYLEYQGQKSAAVIDANTLLYLSKTLDLFELTTDEMKAIAIPTLIIGITTDALFPVWQQQELACELLGNGTPTSYFELPSIYGHDTFLIDKAGVGAALKEFLETIMPAQSHRTNIISLDHY